MKTLILLLTTVLSFGQIKINDKESFNFSVTIDPYASYKEKGLCVGAEIEYTGALYTRFGLTHFSKLKDGYTDVIGAVGIVLSIDQFERTTAYSGLRLGVIVRERANATAGLEIGINHKISDSFLIGIRGSCDYRSDWTFYDATPKMQYSSFLKIGYIYN